MTVRNIMQVKFNWQDVINTEKRYFWTVEYLNSRNIEYESSKINRYFWTVYNIRETEKNIVVSWTIHADSRKNLLDIINEIKWNIIINEQADLEIFEENWRWKTKAVCNWIEFSENHYNIVWTDFQASFLSLDYIKEVEKTEYSENEISSLSYWTEIMRGWNAPAETYIKIDVESASEITGIEIESWSYKMNIEAEINSWDEIVIDGINKEVKHNWEETKFFWTFLILDQKENDMWISFEWESVKYDLYLYYHKSYK